MLTKKGNTQATFENEVVEWCEPRMGIKNLICAQRPISWKSQWAFIYAYIGFIVIRTKYKLHVLTYWLNTMLIDYITF